MSLFCASGAAMRLVQVFRTVYTERSELEEFET